MLVRNATYYSFNPPKGLARFRFGSNFIGNFSIDNLVVREDETPVYRAEVLTANDYSPFGAPMAGRSFKADNVLVKNTLYTSNFTTGG